MDGKRFTPTLIKSLQKYNGQKLIKDVAAGIMVAIIALPLSIALAIASGVRPENGLYSAIIGGFFVSLLSGSRVQIGGITAATVMTVSLIVGEFGMAGLAVASIMAGIFLIIMGICKFGSLLKYVPITITTGFTTGIAIGIFVGQLKEFLGLTIEGEMPVRVLDKFIVCFKAITTCSVPALLTGILSVAILLIFPKITKKIPNTIVMIIIMTIAVQVLNVPVHTVKAIYGEVPAHFPVFSLPQFQWERLDELFIPSLTLAILIAIVSLLSCVVTDSMIGKRHNSNMELCAQGAANIFCGFFGAVPVGGAVARSTSGVKNGGKSQIVGIVHSVVVCGMLLFMMPLVSYIPMPSLAALLMVVAYRMISFDEISYTFKNAPKSDTIVLLATIIVAVLVNLMAAMEVGVLLAALLFMRRMAEVTSVEDWKYIGEEEELAEEDMEWKVVPKHTQVYELSGAMFFAASDKILTISPNENCKCLILRMHSVTAIDATAMHRLEHVLFHCKKRHIVMILAHVKEQPLSVMKKAGFDLAVGEENFCAHIEDALKRAETIS